jgi:hypothetical protein
MMKSIFARIFLAPTFSVIVSVVLALPAMGQNPATAPPGQSSNRDAKETQTPIKGFNEYENFRGMVNSSGTLLKLDSTLGYDFNSYVGVFTGVPLYFAYDSTNTPGQPRVHDAGAGDAYFGVEVYVPNSIVNYSTTLTVSAPTGSVSKGFSPGEPTLDWNNRFRHHFGRFTPFVAAGLGNTVPDSQLVTRNFTSLGKVGHFEEGAEVELTQRVYLGGSAYQIVPFGNQQVFNRFETAIPRDGNSGQGKGGPGHDDGGPAPGQPPPGNTGQPSASGDDLTQERGFGAWLGFEPTRIVRLEMGYTRSVTFALNSFSFNVGFNVGKLFRSRQPH